jgi:hypothetical protein
MATTICHTKLPCPAISLAIVCLIARLYAVLQLFNRPLEFVCQVYLGLTRLVISLVHGHSYGKICHSCNKIFSQLSRSHLSITYQSMTKFY